MAQRQVGRTHKTLDISGLVELTICVIIENRDKEGLVALKKALQRLSISDYREKLAAIKQRLDETSRKLSPGPSVPLNETSSNAILHYNQCGNQIKTAKVIGDRKALNVIRKSFQGYADLHPKQKQPVLTLIADAIASLPSELPADATALRALSAPLYTP